MIESTKGCWMPFLAMLMLSGCAHGMDEAVCVDSATETLYVTVTNQSRSTIAVPDDAPHIGCCNTVGLAIAVTDANGNELKRCARSDDFGEPSLINLSPSESKRYAFSEMTVRSIYCKVDLKKHFITARFSDQGTSQRLLPVANPVRACGKRSKDSIRDTSPDTH